MEPPAREPSMMEGSRVVGVEARYSTSSSAGRLQAAGLQVHKYCATAVVSMENCVCWAEGKEQMSCYI